MLLNDTDSSAGLEPLEDDEMQGKEDPQPGDSFFFDFNRYQIKSSGTNSTPHLQKALKEGKIYWPGQDQIKEESLWLIPNCESGSTMHTNVSPELQGFNLDPIQDSSLFRKISEDDEIQATDPFKHPPTLRTNLKYSQLPLQKSPFLQHSQVQM